MVFALVTMSTVQIVWLRSSVKMRQQIFDDNVQHSLNQLSENADAAPPQISSRLIWKRFRNPTKTTSFNPLRVLGTSLDDAENRMLNRVRALKIDSLDPPSSSRHMALEIPVSRVRF